MQDRLQGMIERIASYPAFVRGMPAAVKLGEETWWQSAGGYAVRRVDKGDNLPEGGTPFTSDTLPRGYGLTKTFTTALVLELAAEGTFHLGYGIKATPFIRGAYNFIGHNGSVQHPATRRCFFINWIRK